MCNSASFILTKTQVFFSLNRDSHEVIISEHGLHADGVNGTNIVRVEFTPRDWDYSTPWETWRYRVDQDILPEWYDNEDCERRVRAAMPAWYAAHVIIGEGTCGCGQSRVVLAGGVCTQIGGECWVYGGGANNQSGGRCWVYGGTNHQAGGECLVYGGGINHQAGGECLVYGGTNHQAGGECVVRSGTYNDLRGKC